MDYVDCDKYIRSEGTRKFLAFLAEQDVTGAFNGRISIWQFLDYVEQKTGAKAIINSGGEEAPYNGELGYRINTEKAESLSFRFSTLQDWIYDLLDYYIDLIR